MPIIFSTTTPASPACQPPARIYFEAPDDALLARVTEKVAELMGRHLSYTFHDEAPGGVTPIILEDVGPSAQPVETTVVNYPHAAGVVPGSLLLKEYPSGRTLTDSVTAPAGADVRRSDLVPGVMHCAKCKFQLNRVTLCVSDGNAYAGDNKTEPCPNGCGPLWPVTWEQEARNCWKALEEMHERLQAAESVTAPAGGVPGYRRRRLS